jgi:hypothetical protein
MMILIEEMRAAVLELWQSLGFERSSRTAAAVVPALVMGIALNAVALHVARRVHPVAHLRCAKTGLRTAVQDGLGKVRTTAASTMKKVCEGQRELCMVGQWVVDRGADAARYRSETRCDWAAQVSTKGVAVRVTLVLPGRVARCRRNVLNLA